MANQETYIITIHIRDIIAAKKGLGIKIAGEVDDRDDRALNFSFEITGKPKNCIKFSDRLDKIAGGVFTHTMLLKGEKIQYVDLHRKIARFG